jgi:cysteine synthase A
LESETVLEIIGKTRLVPLQHMVPVRSARILVKLEYENPTGSMKDRMALAMIEAAEADGRRWVRASRLSRAQPEGRPRR